LTFWDIDGKARKLQASEVVSDDQIPALRFNRAGLLYFGFPPHFSAEY
jgi:hypothetical protein